MKIQKLFIKEYNYRNVAINSSISSSAQACVIIQTRFILAHGSFWTSIVSAIGSFFLAINSAVTRRTLTSISLRQIDASSSVVTWLRSAFIYINFATSSGETSRTETLHSVSHWYAKTSVLTCTFSTLNRFTFFPSTCSGSFGFHIRRTLLTRRLARLSLIKVSRTRSARCQTGIRIKSGRTFGSAIFLSGSRRLVRKTVSRARLTIFESACWRFSCVAVSRTLQTRY